MRRNRPRGFTTLELLIALAIFGLLLAFCAFMLNSTRAAQRDTDRVSDIMVLRSALSQYWLRNAAYPVNEEVYLGAPDSGVAGISSEGFVGEGGGGTVLLEFIPTGPKRNEFYRYSGDARGYSIQFSTERETVFGPEGTYYAHSNSVDQEDVLK